MFPCEIIDSIYGASYKNRYINGEIVYGDNIKEYIKETLYDLDDDYDAFINFYNNIIEND